ncbi:MAG: ATPase, partial [Methanomicrobiales archaeon]|nr:ATPase [Methanomicrobiales archaeon]
LLRGRGYVLPDDVKAVAHDVLRHRILLTYLAEAEEIVVDSVIDEIIRIVPIP